jgi:hypothetical protein
VLHHVRLSGGGANLAERDDSSVADHSLLHRGHGLQRRQQAVRVRRAAHVGHKVAQLLRDSLQHLVLVVFALLQKRDQLLARPLLAQRQRDSLQPTHAVQLHLHVVVLRATWAV